VTFERIGLGVLIALVTGAGADAGVAPAPASAASARVSRVGPDRTTFRRSAPAYIQAPTSRAPSGPPLTTGAGNNVGSDSEETTAGAQQAGVDPLVSNGLASPTCTGELAGELSWASRRNCATSGFVAAPAPTGDYGIDVHINTGVFGLSSGVLLSIVQDVVVTPLWMALVWAVHALVVMLEWCFEIDLLGSASSGLGRGLRAMQAAFTNPWLALALAVASMLVLYHGLIRRRVAETLGEALVMGVMMAGGIWVIVDPTGTIGALGEWANRASLGTLAVTATGTPTGPGRALGGSLGTLFAAAIEVPWCYLEFGDVGWCREPSRLDPRLRRAGLAIAAEELARIRCASSSAGPPPAWAVPAPSVAAPIACAPVGGAQAKALEHSAELLRDARSNGAIFLALPANGPARNSINEQGSLLRTLCQSSEATDCRGPTAAQAEFRTNAGTWPRLGGLLLIAGGLLGMLLLLGFVAVRLLAAAIFSLLYLLLAPAMVLAPAFGDGGRALFRRWVAQLLGAAVSKLVFSFLLGVVLAVLAILSDLATLGWWTQWLLMSAFWWSAYTRRHQALGVAAGTFADRATAGVHAQRHSVARRLGGALEAPRKGVAAARWAKGRFGSQTPEVEPRKRSRIAHERARVGIDEQVTRGLEGAFRDARARAEAAPEIQRRLAGERVRLERIGRERAEALAGGDTRRAAELGYREAHLRDKLEHEREALNAAQRLVHESRRAQRRGDGTHSRERREAHMRLLDEQAALPSAVAVRRGGERRDYRALAGLAGYGREEYEQLDPAHQRAARLEIDRELALRRELGETARMLESRADTSRMGRRERHKAGRGFDGTSQRPMSNAGQSPPGSRGKRSGIEAWREQARADPSLPSSAGSSVMRDAHEVAARRKRQLGRDRP
jgi:hypothetical protein